MADYNNELQGSLFVNDKQGNDRRPDFKGSIVIGGKKYWLSAWKRVPQNGGNQYLSLKAELAEARNDDNDLPAGSNTQRNAFDI